MRTVSSMRRLIVIAVIGLGVIALMSPTPAGADEPGESEQSAQLVRQAIALIVNTPGDMARIEDKIVDALDAPDQDGVDLAIVRQARTAFGRRDMHETRALLERSIGARPHLGNDEPLPIGETGGQPGRAVGAQTGIDVVSDPLAPDRRRSGADWLVLAVLAATAAAGVWLAARFRPHAHQEVRP